MAKPQKNKQLKEYLKTEIKKKEDTIAYLNFQKIKFESMLSELNEK